MYYRNKNSWCSIKRTQKLKRSKPYYQRYSLKLNLINDVKDFVVFLVWKCQKIKPCCFYKQKTPIESKYIPPTMNTNFRHIYMQLLYACIQSELSSGSVWEPKGLHQWNYPYSELLSSCWLRYNQPTTISWKSMPKPLKKDRYQCYLPVNKCHKSCCKG